MGAKVELGADNVAGVVGVKHLLFLCGKARMRSPTAVEVCRRWQGVDADFAGLSNDADEPLTLDQIDTAEIIFVMEQRQKKRLRTLFGRQLANKRIVCLDIPDKYDFMQAELVTVLEAKLSNLLGLPR